MIHKAWLHRIGALLMSIALVYVTHTPLMAQPAGADVRIKPLPIAASNIFMPLIQSDPMLTIKEADDPVVDLAIVESVALSTTAEFPLTINAVVRGSLPNECYQIAKIQQVRNGDQIRLVIATRYRPERQICAAVLTPVAETVTLNLAGLTAGNYTVVVHDSQASFTVTTDNLAPNKSYLPLVRH